MLVQSGRRDGDGLTVGGMLVGVVGVTVASTTVDDVTLEFGVGVPFGDTLMMQMILVQRSLTGFSSAVQP